MLRGLSEMSQDRVVAQEFLASGEVTLERSEERCGCNWSRLSYLADFKSRPEEDPRSADRLACAKAVQRVLCWDWWPRLPGGETDNPHKNMWPALCNLKIMSHFGSSSWGVMNGNLLLDGLQLGPGMVPRV